MCPREIAIISLGISWGTISEGIFPEGSSYGIIGIIPPKTGEEVALSRVLQMVGHRFQLSRARHDEHVAWKQNKERHTADCLAPPFTLFPR